MNIIKIFLRTLFSRFGFEIRGKGLVEAFYQVDPFFNQIYDEAQKKTQMEGTDNRLRRERHYVLNYLINGNNGLYGCEWLMGDSKTGEIASIELALYNTPVKRTKNGFYWSCNLPHNPNVKRELAFGLPPSLTDRIPNVFGNSQEMRAEKFQELEKEYYGKIDTEIAKKIISSDPICINSCDAKLTNSKLI